MGELIENSGAVARLNPRYFGRLPSEELVQIRRNLNSVLENRGWGLESFQRPPTELIPASETALVPKQSGDLQAIPKRSDRMELGSVLSPSQLRTFLDCSAKWWFKHALLLPEPKTSALALGLAVHKTLEVNFRQKLETREDVEAAGMLMLFRDAWREQMGETEFREDEEPLAIGKLGEKLIAKYMEEAAPKIEPAAVELDVEGQIGGVTVRGRIDLLDVEGRIVDVKTAARRPSCVSPDYAFQIATYRQITPGASGEARLDHLVKTQTIQLVQQVFTVGDEDMRATQTIYPLVQEGMQGGLYFPNRQSLMCGRKQCPFWRQCEREFGGTVREA